MSALPPPIGRAIGIDVSASRQAGRLTWIAVIAASPTGPALASIAPAADLLGGAIAPETVFPALAEWIAGQDQAVVGVDSPFGLPRRLVAEGDWLAFLRGFPIRYADPDAFREACRKTAGGRELRRACDREARTPFAAYNLRLYRQTWWVIAGLLRPLIMADRARAAPMQQVDRGLPILIEACPASSLKRMDAYRSYKGVDHSRRDARQGIVQVLANEGLRIPAPLTHLIVADPGGDGLDAVIAAWAAWRTAHADGSFNPRSDADRLEARVYF